MADPLKIPPVAFLDDRTNDISRPWRDLLEGWTDRLFDYLWTDLDFTGSDLTDLETRNHNDLQFTRLTKAINYQMLATDDMVLADASGGSIIISLPDIASQGVYSVKKIDSSANTVTVAPLSGLIDGEVDMTIYQQNDCISSVSDQSNWSIE